MNYLAHAYLSNYDDDLLFGNFIADGIRGNDFGDLNERVKQGIKMHRLIDEYTDQHPGNLRVKKLLYPSVSKYAGVVLDIFYDHLLALDWELHSRVSLEEFVEKVYLLIEARREELPARSAYMFPYMRKGNWLLNYREEAGIFRSLQGLQSRIKGNPPLTKGGEQAFILIEEIRPLFRIFFADLKLAVAGL